MKLFHECFISSSVALRPGIIPAQQMVVLSDMLTCEVLGVCKKLSLSPQDLQLPLDISLSTCLQCGGEGLRLGRPP